MCVCVQQRVTKDVCAYIRHYESSASVLLPGIAAVSDADRLFVSGFEALCLENHLFARAHFLHSHPFFVFYSSFITQVSGCFVVFFIFLISPTVFFIF